MVAKEVHTSLQLEPERPEGATPPAPFSHQAHLSSRPWTPPLSERPRAATAPSRAAAAPPATPHAHTAAVQLLLGAFERHGDDRAGQPLFILSTEGLEPEPIMRLLGPERVSRIGMPAGSNWEN